MDGGSFPEMLDACFYQIMDLEILNNYDTFVYLDGNVAPVTGYGSAWGLMRRDSSLICTVLMHTANCKKLTSTSLYTMLVCNIHF